METDINLFIIPSNSSKLITPSPLTSTYFIIASQTYSSTFFQAHSIFLISSELIDPLLSISNILNA